MGSNNKKRTVLKRIKTALVIFVAVLVLLELLVICLSAFGGPEAVSALPVYIMEVQSDSMAPKLLEGDSILSVNTPFEKITVGDIITFYNNGDFITHEVVEVNPDNTLITKGLMNSYTDGIITEELYVGKVLFKLPLHSMFLKITETTEGKLVFIATVLVLIFGYPAIKWCLLKLASRNDNKKENN